MGARLRCMGVNPQFNDKDNPARPARAILIGSLYTQLGPMGRALEWCIVRRFAYFLSLSFDRRVLLVALRRSAYPALLPGGAGDEGENRNAPHNKGVGRRQQQDFRQTTHACDTRDLSQGMELLLRCGSAIASHFEQQIDSTCQLALVDRVTQSTQERPVEHALDLIRRAG